MTDAPHGPGIFVVYAQPSKKLSQGEFDDWYNNEHGPARTRLPWIHNGYRYVADDEARPQYLALYDADDMANFFADKAYTDLLANRSARESRIVKDQLDTLDRRFYTLLGETGSVTEPPRVVMMVDVVLDDKDVDEVDRWYIEEHIALVAKIKGWLRTRRFRQFEPKRKDGKVAFLAVHEFVDQQIIYQGGHEASKGTPWKTRVKEELSAVQWDERVFTLYHVFEPRG